MGFVWAKRGGNIIKWWGARQFANRKNATGWGSNPRLQNRFSGRTGNTILPYTIR